MDLFSRLLDHLAFIFPCSIVYKQSQKTPALFIFKVSLILQKPQEERSGEDLEVLRESKDVINEVQERWRKRDEAKRRLEEFEDPEDVLREKCQTLAQAIAQSQHLVIYTGAGISTAAKIPDYRGPNGIWTRLQKGEEIG